MGLHSVMLRQGRFLRASGAFGSSINGVRKGAESMQRAIVAYRTDEERHSVALLECGHSQHVRHHPPMTSRPWVLTEAGRNSRLGMFLNCVLCDRAVERDTTPVAG